PAVSDLLGIDQPATDSDDTEETAEWVDRIQTLAQSVDQELAHRLSDSADALPVLIGRTPGEEYLKREPRARLEMTVEAIVEMVRLTTHWGTVVLSADDLHVVDEDSLNALERLLFAAVHDPLLLIGVYRDDGTQTEEGLRTPVEATSHMLRLGGIERSALIELSTRVLKGPADGSMADFLASRVGGNPFYAAEMLRYLAETGHVRNGPGGYEPVQTDSGIPESISSILVERLDSMPASIRRVSHIAALMGVEFEVSLLDRIIDDVDIERALEDGMAARLWSRIDERTFQFSQTLIRDAIVSMQLDSERRNLHTAIFEALRAQYGDDPAHSAELAYHAEESGDSARAGVYLWQAFEFAKANFKNAKAVDFLYRYLRQCGSHEQRLIAYIELGGIYELIGDWEKAADALTYALGVSLLARKIRERISVLTSLSQIYQRLGRAREAVEVASHAVEYAENEPQGYGLAEALLALGRAHWAEGKLDAAEARMKRSVEIATERGDGKTEGLALYHSGVIRRDRNDFAGALRLYKKAEEMLTEHADSQLATFPVYDMAVLLQYEGDLETSQEYFERVLEVYHKTGYRSGASAAVLNLGVLRDRRGDFDGAIEYFEQAREIAESIGEQLAIAYTLFSLGSTYYKMFENRKALSYLKDSLRLMRTLGAKGYYPFPLSYLAALYSRAGDIDRVISMCSYHLAVVRDLGSDPENGLALLSLARVLAKKGYESVSETMRAQLEEIGRYYEVDPRDPDTVFRKAIALSKNAQYVNTLIPAHYHYSRYLDEHGQAKQAASHIAEAYRLAKSATWERYIRTLESRHDSRLLQPDAREDEYTHSDEHTSEEVTSEERASGDLASSGEERHTHDSDGDAGRMENEPALDTTG
ncbi:MAG: ATP-binding protein, partial [Spirochaetia bacterium]